MGRKEKLYFCNAMRAARKKPNYQHEKNILFFVLCYGIFSYSLAIVGAIAVSFQKGFSYELFSSSVLSVLKELYLLTPEHQGLTYVLFIAFTFLFTYWFYFYRVPVKKRSYCDFKTFVHFGMFLPVTLVIGLHVFNMITLG
ncbi:MAG: hypothetical protein V4467_01285 [Patescibacteria group bacterium]